MMTLTRGVVQGAALVAMITLVGCPEGAAAGGGGAATAEREAKAVALLKKIATTQSLFYESDADKNGTQDYARSLGAMVSAGFLADTLQGDTHEGYAYAVYSGDDQSMGQMWVAIATPEAGQPGRAFLIDQAQCVYEQIPAETPPDAERTKVVTALDEIAKNRKADNAAAADAALTALRAEGVGSVIDFNKDGARWCLHTAMGPLKWKYTADETRGTLVFQFVPPAAPTPTTSR
jgi:hypothetical protein